MIDTGYLEDDFCKNLQVLLAAGNIAESWGVADIQDNIPVRTPGPFPALFVQWQDTSDGNTTTMAYPTAIYDCRIKARIILVLAGMQAQSTNVSNRKLLRKIANYIKKNPTINGFCNTIEPPRIVSGEQLFTNSGGYIFSDGAVEIEAKISLTLTHSS